MMLKEGLTRTQTLVVTSEHSAKNLGSGNLNVYATPAMVALMENTACLCIEDTLDDGLDSVGIEIKAKHIKATKIGAKVSCTAMLIEVDGKKLTFELEASDEEGLIGTALHRRYIIDPIKFLARLK